MLVEKYKMRKIKVIWLLKNQSVFADKDSRKQRGNDAATDISAINAFIRLFLGELSCQYFQGT